MFSRFEPGGTRHHFRPRIPTHAGNTINIMVAELEGYVATTNAVAYTTIRIPE